MWKPGLSTSHMSSSALPLRDTGTLMSQRREEPAEFTLWFKDKHEPLSLGIRFFFVTQENTQKNRSMGNKEHCSCLCKRTLEGPEMVIYSVMQYQPEGWGRRIAIQDQTGLLHKTIYITGLEYDSEGKSTYCPCRRLFRHAVVHNYLEAYTWFTQINAAKVLWTYAESQTNTRLSQKPRSKDKGNLVLCPCSGADMARPISS